MSTYDFCQNIMAYRKNRTPDPRAGPYTPDNGTSYRTPDLDPWTWLWTPDHSAGPQTLDSMVEPQTMDPREGLQTTDNRTWPQIPDPWTGLPTLDTGSSNMSQNRTHDQWPMTPRQDCIQKKGPISEKTYLYWQIVILLVLTQTLCSFEIIGLIIFHSKSKAEPDLILVVKSEVILFLTLVNQVKRFIKIFDI